MRLDGPVTEDETSNVIVAEGYLSASHRYQSDDDRYVNRQMLRNHFPAWVLNGEE